MVIGSIIAIATAGYVTPAILAGAIGGFTAGAVTVVGTAGVNPTQSLFGGAFLGGLGGAIGPGTFTGLGGVPEAGFAASNFLPAVGAGAITGAATAAVSTAMFGGSFGHNVLTGALGGAAGGATFFALGAAWNVLNRAADPLAGLQLAAAAGSGESMSDATMNLSDSGNASYWETFKMNWWKNFNETNRVFFSLQGSALTTAYSMFFSAPRVAGAVGTVTPLQALGSLSSGGIANLGVGGTIASAVANFSINYAVVNLGFITGNAIGSAAVALGQTPLR
jgi:hypothetical protein